MAQEKVWERIELSDGTRYDGEICPSFYCVGIALTFGHADVFNFICFARS